MDVNDNLNHPEKLISSDDAAESGHLNSSCGIQDEDLINHEELSSIDISEACRNPVQGIEKLTEEHNQVSETFTEEYDQASETLTEELNQVSETLSEEHNQANETLTDENNQASETLIDELNQDSETLSEENNQASETLAEELNQASEILLEEPNQASETLSEEPNQASETLTDDLNQTSEILTDELNQVIQQDSVHENNIDKKINNDLINSFQDTEEDKNTSTDDKGNENLSIEIEAQNQSQNVCSEIFNCCEKIEDHKDSFDENETSAHLKLDLDVEILRNSKQQESDNFQIIEAKGNISMEFELSDSEVRRDINAPNDVEINSEHDKNTTEINESSNVSCEEKITEELIEENKSSDIFCEEKITQELMEEESLNQLSTKYIQTDIKNFLGECSTEDVSDQEEPLKKLRRTSESNSLKKLSIVDSLLDKMRQTNSDSSETETVVKPSEKTTEESEDDLLVELKAPLRFTKPSNPNQLPTPIVKNQKIASAFTNTLEDYQRTVARQKQNLLPQERDKSEVNERLQVPQMKEPRSLPHRPRTVAEKRKLLHDTNLKYLMVEQEGKIFKQVQRHKMQNPINFALLDTLLHENVPIQRGAHKVLAWLRTREGKFIQQYMDVDGNTLKLNGSIGNHDAKFLPEQSSKPFSKRRKTMMRSTRCCRGGRISKQTFESFVNNESIRKFVKKANSDHFLSFEKKFLDHKLLSIKPRPLSKKIEFINENFKLNDNKDEDDLFLGNYSRFDLPNILMKVTVETRKALDQNCKMYLREILPYKDLDENWCEFALSTLVEKEREKNGKEKDFEFKIPYENNKQNIIVREISKSKDNRDKFLTSYDDDSNEDSSDDDMEWTFAKDVDKNDLLECEIVDIIKDLTNSVFLNVNDDLFTQIDPHDSRVISESSPIKSKEAVDELSSLPKTTKDSKSRRMMSELKKLNANIYKSDTVNVEDEQDIRRHATAHLGKIERELRPTVIVTESNTVLLGNQDKDSRRIKRVPKKFADYLKPTWSALSDAEDEPLNKRMKFNNDETNYENLSHSHLKEVRDEVKKIIHCCVDLRRLHHLENVSVWCLVHKLYKCDCKRFAPIPSQSFPTRISNPQQSQPTTLLKTTAQLALRMSQTKPKINIASTKAILIEESSDDDENENYSDNETSRRVIPVKIKMGKENKNSNASAFFSNVDGIPKLEITNLIDLINGGIGPIFINVYDCKTMRLNPITRSILNNKSALIYSNQSAYFIDKTRVDLKKLDFSQFEEELDHPIFILQSKDTIPLPVSSTMSANFFKIIFNKDSESCIQVTERGALNEISGIIDSILRNVRKKIEVQIGDETNDLIKEQISRLSRESSRSRSTSLSFSSSNSSPLHFQGKQLIEAPPPGIKTPLMEEFNKIFSMRMQRLVSLVSSNTLGLRPSFEMLNKFYLYQWKLLLKSYEEELVQIWLVTLESEQDKKYQLMVLTHTNVKPEIEHARRENIVNIRKLNISDKIPELARLIILRVEKKCINNMTILFYGCKGYLRICGMLNSKEDYTKSFIAKPTKLTHPRVTAKIQKIYNIWYQSMMKKKSENEKEKENQEEKVVEKNKPVTPQQNQSLPVNPTRFLPMMRKMSGNNATHSEYKWFLFNISDDFSDIFIKSWRRYLSYRVIMEAIEKAKQRKRAIQLRPSMQVSKWPKIYALPAAPLSFKEHESMTENFLIFGPYLRHSNSNLLLMQNVDGKLMLRDEYEKHNKIKRTSRTRCLWIYANTLKCINDADPLPLRLVWGKHGVDHHSVEDTVRTIKQENDSESS